ncbi:tRNA (guanosine(46)-N7)-methyltransferase TrmB [Clostridium sp. BJN0001]|uniref:tRNA (guanosine(46)-N7)-methyltransferase TrmB n=1 Tax=Clostridium sp. BJN0001 TaxID=2930219 RepID=UPI001FD3B6A4|nr:tRNA (guanosine(46)-N7)-methyltransferase TrmB [Clostridium sp. BJN0001]
MRMRRKPWARPELLSCDFFIADPKKYKGKWHQLFLNDKPIFLELGCGKGNFVSESASRNLDVNHIAIDIKDEVLVLAKRNIEKVYKEKNIDKIDNVFIMPQEICLIDEIFSKEDIVDRIYINFCNPWPKKRHKKRRLTHTNQLLKYRNFLKDGGKIYFKTDDDDLFKESLDYFSECKFSIEYITYDLHKSGYEDNIVTEHEKMFSEKNINIKFLIAKKEK